MKPSKLKRHWPVQPGYYLIVDSYVRMPIGVLHTTGSYDSPERIEHYWVSGTTRSIDRKPCVEWDDDWRHERIDL